MFLYFCLLNSSTQSWVCFDSKQHSCLGTTFLRKALYVITVDLKIFKIALTTEWLKTNNFLKYFLHSIISPLTVLSVRICFWKRKKTFIFQIFVYPKNDASSQNIFLNLWKDQKTYLHCTNAKKCFWTKYYNSQKFR